MRIALDDFGTGYSSLSYLRRFPFDKIKIDRSFISDIGQSEDRSPIVQAVVHMAAARHMATTAEGVETEAQREVLRAARMQPDAGLAVQPGRAGGETEAAVVGAGGGGLARPVTRIPRSTMSGCLQQSDTGDMGGRQLGGDHLRTSPRTCRRRLPLLLRRSEIRLPGGFLAARRRGDHLGFFLLRLLGFAITALLAFCHVALRWWFELVELIRLQQPSTRGADPDVHAAFAQQFSREAQRDRRLATTEIGAAVFVGPADQIRHTCCPSQ